MKLSAAIRRFDAQLRADGKSPQTLAVYLQDLRSFRRWLGKDLDVGKITPELLARFFTSRCFTCRADGSLKRATSLNRTKSAIRSFFRFLSDAAHIRRNPARLVRLSRTNRKPPSWLSQKETEQLLKTIRKARTPIARRDYTIFGLLLGTGIRLGTLVALNVEDVVLVRSTVQVKGKGGMEQLVFLSRALKRQLKSYLVGRRDPGAPLFLSNRGSRLGSRQVELRLEYWVNQSGIHSRCTVHTLRHTFATRLYEQTGDLRLVQRALGHRRVATTEIYTHISDARLKRAVQAIKL